MAGFVEETLKILILALAALPVRAEEPVEAKATLPGGALTYLHSEPRAAAPVVISLPGGAATPENARALFTQWRELVAPRGWAVLVPLLYSGNDPGAKALDLALADILKRVNADPLRVYLAGAGPSATEVFYTLSRLPDRFAAGLAIQGNPAPAINTNRLFGANTQAVPVLWIQPPPGTELARQKLAAAQYNVQVRDNLTDAQILDWLAGQRRDAFPSTIDCETGNPDFGRCYWIEMTKFDPRRRNDALPSTRVHPGSGASLGLGGFGFDAGAAVPGVLVGWLPDGYQGPLKLNDRILSVAGKTIADGREYLRFMDEMKDEKPVAVVVERGKERLRLETKIVLPKREEVITARVQGRYLADQKEALIISRAVTEMRVTIPEGWAPLNLSWNGVDLKADSAGCWLLSQEQDPPSARRCEAAAQVR